MLVRLEDICVYYFPRRLDFNIILNSVYFLSFARCALLLEGPWPSSLFLSQGLRDGILVD